MFYSGLGKGGADKAAALTAKDGGVTLKNALLAKDYKIGDITNWKPPSAAMALKSSGKATVIIGSKSGGGEIWQLVERPLLNINPRITGLALLDGTGGLIGTFPRVFERGSFLTCPIGTEQVTVDAISTGGK